MGFYLPAGATQIGSGPFYFDPNGQPSSLFNQNGVGSWETITDPERGEIYQSKPIADSQLAIMRARVVGVDGRTEAAIIDFSANNSGERNSDYLVAELARVSDGGLLSNWSSRSEPHEVWVGGRLTGSFAELTELRFIYRKDGSVSGGRDNAWVDDVMLAPSLAFADETGEQPGSGGGTEPDPEPGAGAIYALQYPLTGQIWPNPGSLVLIATAPPDETAP